MSLTHTLQGQASAWLLARPSNHQINRASLTLASALLLLLVAGILLISILQWNLSEQIQKNQLHRAETYLQESTAILNMAIEFGNAHRSTLALLLARDPEESADALQRRQAALTAYKKNLAEINTTQSPKVASVFTPCQSTDGMAARWPRSCNAAINWSRLGISICPRRPSSPRG